jgi:hypothetical protein
MRSLRNLLAATCVAALLAAPATAHDDGTLHVHADGVANVPAWVFGVASLVVAATLLRRRRPAAQRARVRA